MINNVQIVVRRSMADERAALGIRTAYAAQSEGYPTSMVLMDDGVYLLLGSISEYLKHMIDLFVENEGRLACFSESLTQRGIRKEDLSSPDIEIIDRESLADLTAEADSINLF